MRILLVNKFIFPKGGAETYTFDVGKMLEEHGHEVQYFGLENEKNTVGNRIGSYVTNMDFSQGIKANLNAPFRIIYSREARKKIRAVLDDFQPDVVHLNNIQYHLTPSIILEINKWRKETKKECKIVYTTHDYQLVCPSHGMFDVNMKPCERCLDGHYIHCLQTKCLKNSRAKSLLGTLDGYMWKYSKAYSYVDAYICCSFFLKSKLDTQKRFRDKTIGLHNFKKEMPHLDNIQKKGYLFDSYYVLPERPDLAALFCWQAINHSYYVQQLSDNNVGFCQDTKGVELVRDAILGDWNNKYKTVLEPFLKRMPDKTFHYVASYMLKGYAMEKKGIAEKYRATSYKSLKRKISSLSDILDNAYGKSYCQISNPTLIGNVVNLGIANANKRKSRAITHSFGMKLRALMLGKEVEITFCDVQRTKKKYKFTDEERLSFVLFGILYASRCNNFHGNVAARMNSINANKDTFKMYTDMFLTEYIILAIHLNSQGALPDMVLNKVKENANLMV